MKKLLVAAFAITVVGSAIFALQDARERAARGGDPVSPLLEAMQRAADQGRVDLESLPTPSPTVVRPRRLAAYGAFLMAALLMLLYGYRPRRYILEWVVGWTASGVAMLLVSRTYPNAQIARAAVGFVGLLMVYNALLGVMAADSYQQRSWSRRKVIAWAGGFLALLAFNRVLLPRVALGVVGYLVVGLLGAWSSMKYIELFRHKRQIGAAVIGFTGLALAASNTFLSRMAPRLLVDGDFTLQLLVLNVFLNSVIGLSMHLLIFEDMTAELRHTNRELATVQEQLRELATTDPLTGCHNRRFLDEALGREVERHRRFGIPLTLLFLDVNRFKQVNDRLGHEVGDRVLRFVARLLKDRLRQVDYVFRWGGDEFVVLMSCRAEEAERKALELKAAFVQAPEMRGLPPGVGLSIGCVEVAPDTTDLAGLIVEADRRMYSDKVAS